ncbi:unnamed protein product [Sphagnum balticum]
MIQWDLLQHRVLEAHKPILNDNQGAAIVDNVVFKARCARRDGAGARIDLHQSLHFINKQRHLRIHEDTALTFPSANSFLNNDNESDDGSTEDFEPGIFLGNQGATDVFPKGADGLVNKAAKKGAQEAVAEKKKEPSLKIQIKLDLNVKITHIDGVIKIGYL